jgi:UDP-glucose 4-epimerase
LNILVTGAAGYIGSIVTEQLVREYDLVIAIDNLQQGHREAVIEGAEFIKAELGSADELEQVFRRYHIDAVAHLAAESIVSRSMTDPRQSFHNNVVYGINLLDTMLKHGVHKLVFSSTAAVYGEPEAVPITESAAEKPVNPYGESKLIFERILHWYGQAYGLSCISLRYFNAAGASERFGEDHHPESHLIPNIMKVALGQDAQIPVFGNDYPTADGSCIRDYIHVADIARAHILALKQLDNHTGNKAYNLGNDKGYSVLEVIETARKVTGAPIPAAIHSKRAGDPAILTASSRLAAAELGWHPEFDSLESIIESAWRWHRKHPQGYR